MKEVKRRAELLFLVLIIPLILPASFCYAATTELVSVNDAGTIGNGNSLGPAISTDGRYIAFRSDATNLVPNDTNQRSDLFVRDLISGKTVRVSVSSSGNQGNDYSFEPVSMSASGRFVTFASSASNLVAGDTNGMTDIFVHDRDSDGNGIYDEPGGISTVRVSISSEGFEGDSISMYPSLSVDGRFVAFQSWASNLVANDTNAVPDIFVHDRDVDGNGIYDEPGGISTVRISLTNEGGQNNYGSAEPSISADGRYVAFYSQSNIIVPFDTNGSFDVFVRDRDTDGNGIYDEPGGASTVRVSVSSEGIQGNSNSTPVGQRAISANGRFVAFQSDSSNLVPNDTNGFTDVFVRDRDTDGNGIYDEPGRVSTVRVSVSSEGVQGNYTVSLHSMSTDGRYIAFWGHAYNLVPNDTNQGYDAFIHDRLTGLTERVSVSSNGGQANPGSAGPSISDDGRYVAFYHGGPSNSNLVPEDTNGLYDVFVRIRDIDFDADTYNEVVDCNDHDPSIHPGAAEIRFDGIDQDCNGYDLTINVTKATYSARRDTLTVEATSALGVNAQLMLSGYGSMTWSKKLSKWTKTVSPAGGNPGTVTVSGIEGSQSAPVQTVR